MMVCSGRGFEIVEEIKKFNAPSLKRIFKGVGCVTNTLSNLHWIHIQMLGLNC
jgi:hypothetical protein